MKTARRQVQQWCRAECDGRQSECGGSERARAAATSNLVRQQNWSGFTRSRRTNASPTKCSLVPRPRSNTTASDGATDRPADDDDCQRRPTSNHSGPVLRQQRWRSSPATGPLDVHALRYARKPRPDRRSNHQCHDATDHQPVATTALIVRSVFCFTSVSSLILSYCAGSRTVACGLCSRRRKLPHVDFPAVTHGSSSVVKCSKTVITHLHFFTF
jgi:hypothetical protein